MTMSNEDILAVVTPERRAMIWQWISEGFRDYYDDDYYSPAARRDHSKSARAMNINSHIVGRARRGIVDMLGMRVSIRGGRVLIVIEDKLRLSFKKLNRNLRSRNYPTKQALAFVGQRLAVNNEDMVPEIGPVQGVLLTELPPEMTNLIAGYRPNELETACEVFIVRPSADGNKMQMRLVEAEMAETLTATETEPVATAISGLITIRPEARERHGNDDSD